MTQEEGIDIHLGIMISFVSLAIGLPIGGILGSLQQQAIDRRAAIKAGVARWEVNAETGDTQFTYLPSHKENEKS